MGKKLFWKILVACFLALSALFTVAGSMIISWIPPAQNRLLTTVLTIAGVGGVLTLGGILKAQSAGRRTAKANADPSQSDGVHPLAFTGYLHFWGSILVISAAPMFFLNRFQQQVNTPQPSPPPKAAIQPSKPVEFPPMHLMGLVCNSDQSTAVIDGETVVIGDMLQGVHIVAIDSMGVTIEMAGVTNRLTLE